MIKCVCDTERVSSLYTAFTRCISQSSKCSYCFGVGEHSHSNVLENEQINLKFEMYVVLNVLCHSL
jgi:hypothetical protein